MKEIDMSRFCRDYKVISTMIRRMLKEQGVKFDDISFSIENTTEGKRVAVHGYDAKMQTRCRAYLKYENLVERLQTR